MILLDILTLGNPEGQAALIDVMNSALDHSCGSLGDREKDSIRGQDPHASTAGDRVLWTCDRAGRLVWAQPGCCRKPYRRDTMASHGNGHSGEDYPTVNNEKYLLNRREFNRFYVTLGSALPLIGPMIVALSSAPARAATSTVKFHDGIILPALGQGSANLGQGRYPEAAEEEALRTGLSLGMTLIDTAEMYSNGRSEKLIGRVIAGQRDRVFMVSKVSPDHVTGNGIAQACDASLARLGTDYLDLYLLHWPSREADLSSIVGAFENLRAEGKIRTWGVSNFKVSDMEDLFRVLHGDRCAANQVLYNLGNRDIEHDLLPWCEQHGMPMMAYSPLGGAGASLLRDPTLTRIGAAHNCSPAAVALAWTIRNGNVIAIPESGSATHVRENSVALSLSLTPDELHMLDAAHPLPNR
jgi:diketogulonate reductase-like aldo/keto reductase